MQITLGAKRYYWGLRSDIHNFKGFFPLVSPLREFFSHPITLKECEDKIRITLDKRESNFLELVGQQIYQRLNSPYLKLLITIPMCFLFRAAARFHEDQRNRNLHA